MTKLIMVLLITIIFLYTCSRKITTVKMELVNEIVYKEEVEEYPIKVVNNKEDFEKVLGNKNKSIFKLYSKLDTLFFDFDNYDYAFSFRKEIDRLEYGKSLSKEHDFCDYLGKTPVFPTYGEADKNIVYIYRLKEKNQYRHQCP